MIKLKQLLTEDPDSIAIKTKRGEVFLDWNEDRATHVFLIYKKQWYDYDIKRNKILSQNDKFNEMVSKSTSEDTKSALRDLSTLPNHNALRYYIAEIYREYKLIKRTAIHKMADAIDEKRNIAGRIFKYGKLYYITFWDDSPDVKKHKNDIDDMINTLNIPKDKMKFEYYEDYDYDGDMNGVFVDYNKYFNVTEPAAVISPQTLQMQKDIIKVKQQAHLMSISGKWKAAMRNL